MATYKVPQDVEADDKLIGPFTFRQFIYLVIVALAIGLGWALAQLFLPLAAIVLPVVFFFGLLALPLRKDQPMEAYMAAMVSFFLKPHLRLWDADGVETVIEITAPKITEVIRVKDITQTEAQRRLSYLADIADTQGWSVRGTGPQNPNSSMIGDVYFEAQQAEDILDANNTVAHNFSNKLDVDAARRHQEMIDIANGKPNQPGAINPRDAANYFATHTPHVDTPPPTITNFHDMHEPKPQPKMPTPQPTPAQAPEPEKPSSPKTATPDIINLASNNDLSIETIAREANRIKAKQNLEEEVVISLR
jgi:hypothetical protein